MKPETRVPACITLAESDLGVVVPDGVLAALAVAAVLAVLAVAAVLAVLAGLAVLAVGVADEASILV